MKSRTLVIFCSIIMYQTLLAQNIAIEDNGQSETTTNNDQTTTTTTTPPPKESHVIKEPEKPSHDRLISWLNVGSKLLKDKIGFSGGRINEALNIGNRATQFATSIGSEIAQESSGLIKQGLNKASNIGNKGIDESADIAKNILIFLSKFPKLRLFTGLGNYGVEVARKYGKNALNNFISMEHRKVDFLEKVAKNGLSNPLASLSQTGTGIGQRFVTNGVQTLTGGIENGMNLLNTVAEKVNIISETLSNTLPAPPNYVYPNN